MTGYKWMLGLFVLWPSILFGYFDVDVMRSATSAPDTVQVNWSGIAASDSLMVSFDLNAVPDAGGRGLDIDRWGYTASGSRTIFDSMPEGGFIYLTLFRKSGGSWLSADTDNILIHDQPFSHPRKGTLFTPLDAGDGDLLKSARFDLLWNTTEEMLGGQSSDPRPDIDSLRIYNPEIISLIHDQAYGISAISVAPNSWDTVSTAMMDSVVVWARAGDLIYIHEDSTTLSIASGSGASLAVAASEGFPTTWFGTNNPMIQLGTGSTLEWCRLDETLTGADQDTLNVVRGWGITSAVNWPIGTKVYLLNSHGGNSDPASYGYHPVMLDGRDGNKIGGLWPWEWKVRLGIDILQWYLSPSSRLCANGFSWDNHYKSNYGFDMGATLVVDDSTFLYSASRYISERDSALYLSYNMISEGFNGVESIAQMTNLVEMNWATAANRWSAARDLMHRVIEGGILKNYRYGMAHDDWMPSSFSVDNEDNDIEAQRLNDAIATVFGGYGVTKTRFTKPKCVWADHYAVGSNGIATFPDTLTSDFSWLGWPVEQWQPLEDDYVQTELMTNGAFTGGIAGWSSSNADSIGIGADTNRLRAVINTGLHETPDNLSLDELWDEYVESPSFNVVHATEYTLRFDVRANSSKIIGASLFSDDELYQAECVFVPETWRTVYVPIYIDTTRTTNDVTGVTVRFGLVPCLQPDALADTVWLDNVSLKQCVTDSMGFQGWGRSFDNGWVGFNFRESAQTVPIPVGTWNRIGAYGAQGTYPWSDPAVNDTSSVSGTISIALRDGAFLFGSLTGDTLPPDPVSGLNDTDITHGTISLIWQASDSTDTEGYEAWVLAGATPPANRGDGSLAGMTKSRLDTTITDTGLEEMTEYSYSLFAFDEAENYSDSAASGQGTWTTDPNPRVNVRLIGDNGPGFQGRIFDAYIRGGTYADENEGWSESVAITYDTSPSDSSDMRYGYLKADISCLIPQSAVLDSAFLSVVFTAVTGSDWVVLYECIDDWDERSATWNHPTDSTSTWSASHGLGAVVDSIEVAVADTFRFDIIEPLRDARAMLTTPQGFVNLTLRDRTQGSDYLRFTSHEGSDLSTGVMRPSISIYYHVEGKEPSPILKKGALEQARIGGQDTIRVRKKE